LCNLLWRAMGVHPSLHFLTIRFGHLNLYGVS
jgi:hypothetical protein